MSDMYARATEAEQALIGAILLDGKRLSEVRKIVAADDFSVPEYAEVFRAACRCADNGDLVDYLTIDTKNIDKKILFAAMEAVPYTKNACEYAKLVKKEAAKRALSELSQKISADVFNDVDTSDITAEVMAFAENLNVEKETAASASDAMKQYLGYRRLLDKNGRQVVPTGFGDLDDILGGGLVNSGFYILAARPGMGKTTMAAAIADNVAKGGRTVLFYSLEMSVEQMSARMLGRNAVIPYTKLMLGKLDGDDYSKLAVVAEKISRLPLFIKETSRLGTNEVNQGMREHNPDLVIIDYLGLMTLSGKRSRYEEITELSAELKRIAKKHKKPILCLAQLNRENTQSSDKRPKLSHLRDSGSLEQDADGVIFLHRPDYYEDEKSEQGREEMEVIVAKNRHGRTGSANFLWYGATGVIRPIWRGK